MHTYQKSDRKSKIEQDKKLKKHVKGFYQTLALMDKVAEELRDKVITEDNIEAEAKEVLGRDIDSMEKFLLLGKLGVKDEKDNS